MQSGEVEHPGVQPPDERAALVQRLDFYRATVSSLVVGLTWKQASSRPLAATDLTPAGLIKHLAWVEDHWFQARLLGRPMPEPWGSRGDTPEKSMDLRPDDSVASLLELYAAACGRSREAADGVSSLGTSAAVGSFGAGPVNLRWILVHMIEETARHAGHLDLLGDELHN
ncbi:MAG: DinB family protein [Acidimicrobiales bacterium]